MTLEETIVAAAGLLPQDVVDGAIAAGLQPGVIRAMILRSNTPQEARANLTTAKEIKALAAFMERGSRYEHMDFDGLQETWATHGLTAAQFRAEAVRDAAERDEHTDTHRPAAYMNTGDHFAARAAHTKAQAKKANHGTD